MVRTLTSKARPANYFLKMAQLALTRDRFIDLEVNAWVWTKNGKKSGINSETLLSS